MSFYRVSNPAAVAVSIPDLGFTIAASAVNVVLSNQFSVDDLYLSADLEALIVAGTLTVQIDYGTGFTSVLAVDYTNRDCIAAFLNVFELTNENNNEKLVNGSDASSGTALHSHDTRYYTKTEVGQATGTTGSDLVGDDDTYTVLAPATTTQKSFNEAVDAALAAFDLDTAYANDTDGILHVIGTTKDLDLESDNANHVKISRKSGADKQILLDTDLVGNEVELGSAVVGALPQVDVRVKTNLIIDGNLTITGTTTDNTVNVLNVTNANIRLRDGATAIAGADSYIEVERGTSGADAQLLWNESVDRWQAGLVGDMATIALLEKNEVVTGDWEFQGPATTAPSLYLTDKAAAATTNLGTSSQIGMEVINNVLAIHDKSRTRFLSVHRMNLSFVGRDNNNNANEYARFGGGFTSNQSSARLINNMTLIGMSIQTNGAETWTARVRKNGVATNLASLAATAQAGVQDATLNVDFTAGDKIEVFIDGSSVDRPVIILEFAQRF